MGLEVIVKMIFCQIFGHSILLPIIGWRKKPTCMKNFQMHVRKIKIRRHQSLVILHAQLPLLLFLARIITLMGNMGVRIASMYHRLIKILSQPLNVSKKFLTWNQVLIHTSTGIIIYQILLFINHENVSLGGMDAGIEMMENIL